MYIQDIFQDMWTSLAVTVFLIQTDQRVIDLVRRAEVSITAGNKVEAEALLDEASIHIRRGGPALRGFGGTVMWVHDKYQFVGRPDKADSLIQYGLDVSRRQAMPQTVQLMLLSRGRYAVAANRFEEAAISLREAVKIGDRIPDKETSMMTRVLPLLSFAEERLGNVREAEALLVRQGKVQPKYPSLPPCSLSETTVVIPHETPYPHSLAAFYEGQQHPEKAEALFRDLIRQSANGSVADRYWALNDLRFFMYQHKRSKDLIEISKTQIAMLLSSPSLAEQVCGREERSRLADVYILEKDFAAAERTIAEVVADSSKLNGNTQENLTRSLSLYVDLAVAKGDFAAAAKALDHCRETAIASNSVHAKTFVHRRGARLQRQLLDASESALARTLMDQQILDARDWFGKGSSEHFQALLDRLELAVKEKDFATLGNSIEEFTEYARKGGNPHLLDLGLRWKSLLPPAQP